MKQTLTAKLQILPSLSEEQILLRTMHTYLSAANAISKHVYETHDLNRTSVNRALYHKLRDEFKLGAQMAQSAIRTVIASYKTILSNKQPWTEVKYKHGFYDLVWNRDYGLKQETFSINTLDGRLKVKFRKAGHEHVFDGTALFGSAKVIRKHGHFYLCVSYTKDVADPLPVKNVVGVDLGINFIATSYDSSGKTRFWNGRPCKQKRAHYKQLRKELQQRQTASARRRLKEIGSRENRWMNDVNHQVTKALVDSNPAGTLFVLEDLTGIRHVTEKVRKKDRYVQVSWPFFDFAQKLRYKAERVGSQVIQVDPRYTSQACPKCGMVRKSNRDKKKHLYTCECCGYKSNDDRIGAMNLYAKGIQYRNAVTAEHISDVKAAVSQPAM